MRSQSASNVPCQECVEGEVGDENAVQKLHDAGEHEEDEESVDGLETGRGGVIVRVEEGVERGGRC